MLALRADAVHLVQQRLDAPWAAPLPAEAYLTGAERRRVDRLRFPHLRRRAARSRALLRLLLGAVRGESPHAVPIALGEQGKPRCPGGPAFNLSHADEDWLLALTPDGRLGVDLERVRPLDDLDAVAGMNFSQRELEALTRVPEASRLRAFYRCWTRKEALVKAMGGGLSLPLQQFSVAVTGGERNCLTELSLPGESLTAWRVLPALDTDDRVAAVALDDSRPRQLIHHSAEDFLSRRR
ncbi:MAG: 4'-phosphopantetheinyl transferase superfamily protein [Ectothiorhodospiraceae bacterium]|nr:4'-phosphopantetheinyl transferase superfamily protein [Ectothiorhodospiraceae bacterium]